MSYAMQRTKRVPPREDDYGALARPWRPFVERHKTNIFENTNKRLALENVRVDTVALRDGVWQVQEFQSKASRLPWLTSYEDGDAMRWHAYPGAQSGDEAMALSRARADKEWRSLKGKMAAISRKHGARKAEAATRGGHEASRSIRSAIAKAPVTGAAATAVKLAMWFDGGGAPEDPDPDGRFDEIEAAGIEGIYHHAVAECGFDPLADLKRARNARALA